MAEKLGFLHKEYQRAVDALAPLLENLPGKIVAIDGWDCVGKTTFGRYLAWRFNSTLVETDLFIVKGRDPVAYRQDEIQRIIEARLSKPRPVIVEGVAVFLF